MPRKTFGRVLRELRRNSGVGIKRFGPEVGVSYSYISKLENDVVPPSEGFVQRAANYFEVDPNVLLLAAGKVPTDVLRILQDNPEEALKLLRAKFGATDAQ